VDRGPSENGSEDERLRILGEHGAEALVGDPAMQSLTAFGAALCETPICAVSLVEGARLWFPARTGLGAAESPRQASFCAQAMRDSEVMEVSDARADPRFAGNPLVTGELHIRFYAGAPLTSEEGTPLGALCVMSPEPRTGLTPLQRQGLQALADQVMARLWAERRAGEGRASLGRAEDAASESDERFRILADTMPQMVWSTRPDGYHDYYNARWYEFTGMPAGSTDGEAWNGMFHPDDQPLAWERWRRSLETGEPYEIEYRLRAANGEYRWTLGRAMPMRDAEGRIVRWFGTCTDIHEQKLLLDQREMISQELSHRIKNIFSIIAGMISLQARRNPDFKAIAQDLRDRIVALGRAHDYVRPHSRASRGGRRANSLQGMLAELFSPYAVDGKARVIVGGDDPPIDDRSATPLALAFHELATNAAKYGALSTVDGAVAVDIRVRGDAVVIGWTETGGPPIEADPVQDGFGSQLVEISAVRQLGATIERDWRRDGLALVLTVPTAVLKRDEFLTAPAG